MVPLSLATVWALVLESVSVPVGSNAMEDPTGPVSALNFHVLRKAFKTSIAERRIPEAQWADHAKALVRELTHNAHVGRGLVDWIIRK